jgi:hypothetical protein
MVVSGAVRLRALEDDVITLRLTDEFRVFVLVVVTEEEEETIDRGGEIVFFWKRLKKRRQNFVNRKKNNSIIDNTYSIRIVRRSSACDNSVPRIFQIYIILRLH